MTTTRDAVLASAREHMTKDAGWLNRAGASVAGGLSRILGAAGGATHKIAPVGAAFDRAAIAASRSQAASTMAHARDQARSAAKAELSAAAATQRAAQHGQLSSAAGPEQRQALRQQFAAAGPSPEMVKAREQLEAIGRPQAPEVTPGNPAGQQPTQFLSPAAKRYLMIGGAGLAGGAVISGGASGAQQALGGQQMAPPQQYPPGY